MKIFVFGDSHAGKFGADPGMFIRLFNAGQATAHNLCNQNGPSYFNLQQSLHEYDPADVFLFVLGEIDCRIHFYYQHMKTGKPISVLIMDTVARYGHIIKSVRDDGRPNVAVLDVPPATRQGNVYELEHYATREERSDIARWFNEILGSWCAAREIPFIRLYPYIADERGFLKDQYATEDGAHVSHLTVPFVVQELSVYFPEVL
jgi:lysophospholipase L1-like esterase